MTEFEAASRKIQSRSADRGMERHPISHCGTCAQPRAPVRVNDLLTTPCGENMACKTFNRTRKPVRQSCRLISAVWNQVSRVETFAEAFGPGLAVDSLFQPKTVAALILRSHGAERLSCSPRRRRGEVCAAKLRYDPNSVLDRVSRRWLASWYAKRSASLALGWSPLHDARGPMCGVGPPSRSTRSVATAAGA